MLECVAEFSLIFVVIVIKHPIYLKVYEGCMVAFLCVSLPLWSYCVFQKEKSNVNDTQSVSNLQKWNYCGYLRVWIWHRELIYWKCVARLQARRQHGGNSDRKLQKAASTPGWREECSFSESRNCEEGWTQTSEKGALQVLALSLVSKCGAGILKTGTNWLGKEPLPGDAIRSKRCNRKLYVSFVPSCFPFCL